MGNQVCSLRYLNYDHKTEYTFIINNLMTKYNLYEDHNYNSFDYNPKKYTYICVQPYLSFYSLFDQKNHLENFLNEIKTSLPINIDSELSFYPM